MNVKNKKPAMNKLNDYTQNYNRIKNETRQSDIDRLTALFSTADEDEKKGIRKAINCLLRIN